MKKGIIIAMLISLQGCSSVTYNYRPDVSRFSIPELNTITSAGLGEPLLDQGVAVEQKILLIKNEGSISAYKIKPGKLIKVGEDDSGEYFTQNIANGINIFSGLLLSNPDVTASIRYSKKDETYCILRPADLTVCGDLDAEISKETVITNDSFRRTLIYSGRVGNKLRISYREFNNDLARSAFNADAEYDLNEGNLIGYAGAKIEIIEATNTLIKYRLIKNFNTK